MIVCESGGHANGLTYFIFRFLRRPQVQAGGRLAAARHADQDHVRAGQVAVALAVVVVQAEVDGLDAVAVLLGHADVREAPHAVVRLGAHG